MFRHGGVSRGGGALLLRGERVVEKWQALRSELNQIKLGKKNVKKAIEPSPTPKPLASQGIGWVTRNGKFTGAKE